jgi:addiction module HigA family antidote
MGDDDQWTVAPGVRVSRWRRLRSRDRRLSLRCDMNETQAFHAIHPGAILKEELEARGISASAFALRLRVAPQRIQEIVAGKRAITPETALRIGTALGPGHGCGSRCSRLTNSTKWRWLSAPRSGPRSIPRRSIGIPCRGLDLPALHRHIKTHRACEMFRWQDRHLNQFCGTKPICSNAQTYFRRPGESRDPGRATCGGEVADGVGLKDENYRTKPNRRGRRAKRRP